MFVKEELEPNVSALRLKTGYDQQLLNADLQELKDMGRVKQPGPYHGGEWVGLSLYSIGGDSNRADAGHLYSPRFRRTSALRKCPYLWKILDELPCPKRSVRLSHLPPGGKILPHHDDCGFQVGLLRLHIPLETHPDVELVIGDEKFNWIPGELWWGNFSRVHWVYNNSPIERIHLVIDVCATESLLKLFPEQMIAEQRQRSLCLSLGCGVRERIYRNVADWYDWMHRPRTRGA